MSDVYGTIVFSKSSDCKFDDQALMKVLGSYSWDNSNSAWVFNEKNKLFFLNACDFMGASQYPSVFPERDAAYIIKQDGIIKRIEASDASEDDICNFHDVIMEVVPLSELASNISGCLASGWIEMACVANEKQRYVYFEKLRVYSSGCAERSVTRTGPFSEPYATREVFDPELKGGAITPKKYMNVDVILTFSTTNELGEAQLRFDLKLPVSKDEVDAVKFIHRKFFKEIVAQCKKYNRNVEELVKISTSSDWNLFTQVTGLPSLDELGHSCKWFFGTGRDDLDEWEQALMKIYGFGTKADMSHVTQMQ